MPSMIRMFGSGTGVVAESEELVCEYVRHTGEGFRSLRPEAGEGPAVDDGQVCLATDVRA